MTAVVSAAAFFGSGYVAAVVLSQNGTGGEPLPINNDQHQNKIDLLATSLEDVQNQLNQCYANLAKSKDRHDQFVVQTEMANSQTNLLHSKIDQKDAKIAGLRNEMERYRSLYLEEMKRNASVATTDNKSGY